MPSNNYNNRTGYEYDEDEFNPNEERINHRLDAVREQIDILRQKAEYFHTEATKYLLSEQRIKAQIYFDAHIAANVIANNVFILTHQYARHELSLVEYKAKANELFDNSNPNIQILNTHREWKEILANVLAAMVGNLLFLAAALTFGTLRLFKPATDAGTKVKALSTVINAIEEDEESTEEDSDYGPYSCA